jgi:hypothetical protein
MTKKIDNTFSKAASELAKLEKVFAENSKLEKAIMESNRDLSAISEVRSHLAKAIAILTPQTITEGVLDGNDEDGFMARSQLYFLAKNAIALHGMIDDRDDLEPWVHTKIVAASEGIDAVRRYTEYNAMKSQAQPEPEAELPVPALPIENESMGAPDYNPAAGQHTTNREYGMFTDEGNDEVAEIVDDIQRRMEQGEFDSPERAIDAAMSDLSNLAEMSRNFEEADDTDVRDQVARDLEMRIGRDSGFGEAVAEGMNFDDKKDSDLKTVAKDMFKSALVQARKKSGVK